jgi:type II secretory pathway pseudopilin PulG
MAPLEQAYSFAAKDASKRRGGFTIVELLVAMALIMLIMAVMSEAFTAGLQAFRSLKGLGDMQERLRVASVQLRRDLTLRHFEGDRKLSDFDPYWYDPNIGNGDQTTRAIGGRPSQGFFRIQTPALPGNATYLRLEGTDGDGIPSWVLDPNNANLPVLHFTSKLVPERKDALRRDQIWTTPIGALAIPSPLPLYEGPPDFRDPNGVLMNSPWAEIAWFLVPTGEVAGTTPLYSLYRRARLMIAPRVDQVYVGISPQLLGQYYGVSCEIDQSNNPATQLLFNNEYDVAESPYAGRQVKRSMSNQNFVSVPAPVGTTNNEPATLQGDDLVVSDVISFEVKVLRRGEADFKDLNDNFIDSSGNLIPAYGGIYDTATSPVGWMGLSGIKITLRIWDFKTQQARQISIIQDF